MNYFFLSTDHFVDKDWFRDDEDYSVLQAGRKTDVTDFWVARICATPAAMDLWQ